MINDIAQFAIYIVYLQPDSAEKQAAEEVYMTLQRLTKECVQDVRVDSAVSGLNELRDCIESRFLPVLLQNLRCIILL